MGQISHPDGLGIAHNGRAVERRLTLSVAEVEVGAAADQSDDDLPALGLAQRHSDRQGRLYRKVKVGERAGGGGGGGNAGLVRNLCTVMSELSD